MPIQRTLLLVALVLAPGLTGCITSRGPEAIRRDLARDAGVRLDREFGLTVKRSAMWIARTALRHSEDEEDLAMLDGIRRVEIGIYRVEGLRPGVDVRRALEPAKFTGFTPLVRVHDDDGDALVLAEQTERGIRTLVVAVADDEEWVIVRIRGRIDALLEDAMRFAFDEAGHPDLGDEAIAEHRAAAADPA
jgi:hypothetical protein